MSVEKHERLERLRELLNFNDDGYFQHYCNGYRQAEQDMKDQISKLTKMLNIAEKAMNKCTDGRVWEGLDVAVMALGINIELNNALAEIDKVKEGL